MWTNHGQDTKKREEGDASQERASGHWKDQTDFFTFFSFFLLFIYFWFLS